MTSDRPYAGGKSRQEAIAEMKRCSGTQFDPRVVAALQSVLEHPADGDVTARSVTSLSSHVPVAAG
jgi:HD-GYP domain-containing protein (c-di-GMP phosphodiesterase class II)